MKKLVEFSLWLVAFTFLTFAVFFVTKISEKEIVLVDLSPRACWLNTKQQVDITVKEPLERMIDDAEKEGMCLVVSSGYRTKEEQERIIEKYGDLAEEADKSEHLTGLAVDIIACPMTNGKRDDSAERLELRKPFDQLPEYKWLSENASEYGFFQTYKEEAWHWRFYKR